MENEGYEKEDQKSNNEKTRNDNSSVNDLVKEKSVISMPTEYKPADKPYSGMGKEDLLRFSDTRFWNTLRLVFLILFWLFWLSLLIAVVVLTIQAPRCTEAPTQEWWQKSTFYQIYVRSFYDTNNDGIGDINGITEKLDYINDINVEAVILSSFYPSTTTGNPDYGYEITDHLDIDPVYGTMDDFENLVAKAHERGIKVILDFIPNHTGLEHPWFVAWDAGTGNANYYTTALDCTSLNNWLSVYGGSAWSTVSTDCYLHQLLETQPELNLRSAQVKAELETILRFWLDRGVDGFRVVGAKYLVEDFDQRDDPLIPGCMDTNDYSCYDHVYTATQPENIALISEWRAIVNSYSTGDNIRVLLSDANDSFNNTIKYYAMGEVDGSNLPLNYQVLQDLDITCGGECVYDIVSQWVDTIPNYATITWMTGHQDELRMTTSLEPKPVGHVLNILKMTLPGSPVVYYGEELGMMSADSSSWTSGCTDPGFVNGTTPCRQESRTPMQWDGSNDAGFTNGSAWLPVTDYATSNVEYQNNPDDEFTQLNVFRKLADLKNTSTALQYGNIHFAVVNENIFSYIREYDGTDRYLISINFGSVVSTDNYVESHDLIPGSAELVISSRRDLYKTGDQVDLKSVELQPQDAVVFIWPYSRP